MYINWDLIQKRSIDPYSPVDSDNVSSLSSAFSNNGSGRGINAGFQLELVTPTDLKITKGIVIKDYIVIHFLDDVILNITDTNAAPNDNYVVLIYQYEKVSPPPVAKIDIIPVNDFDSTKHLIIGKVTLNLAGTEIISVSYENREENTALTPITEHSILELCDTPSYNNGTGFSGKANNILVVDTNGTKLDFAELSSDNFTISGNCVIVCALDGFSSADFLHTNGSNTPSADISWHNFRLTDLANPVDQKDAVPLQCLQECINAEIQARQTADQNLQTNIDCLCQCVDNISANPPSSVSNAECLNGICGTCYSLCTHTHAFNTLQCVPADFGLCGQILMSDGSKVVWGDVNTLRSATFVGLVDTPSSYSTSDINKVLVVDYQNGDPNNPLNIVFKSLDSFISLKDLGLVNPALNPVSNQVLTWDSTNNYWTACDVGSLSSTSSFIGLSDTPSDYNNANDKLLKVCVDVNGSRIEFVDAGTVIGSTLALTDLCDVDTSGGITGQVLTLVDDNGTLLWKPQTVSSCSCTYDYFHLLKDTPSTYCGYDGYILTVCYDPNGTQTGIKFTQPNLIANKFKLNDLLDVNTGILDSTNNGLLLGWNGSEWVACDLSSCFTLAGGGVDCFVNLCDTPNSYNGYSPIANLCPYMLTVNDSGNGISFCNFGDVFNVLKQTISLNDLQNVCAPFAFDPAYAGNVLHYTQNCVICLAPYYIQCLGNVCIVNPSEGQVLVYQSGYWINSTVSTGSNVSNLEDLTDVTNTTNAPDGYVLASCNGCWAPVASSCLNQGATCITGGVSDPPQSADIGTLYIQYID